MFVGNKKTTLKSFNHSRHSLGLFALSALIGMAGCGTASTDFGIEDDTASVASLAQARGTVGRRILTLHKTALSVDPCDADPGEECSDEESVNTAGCALAVVYTPDADGDDVETKPYILDEGVGSIQIPFTQGSRIEVLSPGATFSEDCQGSDRCEMIFEGMLHDSIGVDIHHTAHQSSCSVIDRDKLGDVDGNGSISVLDALRAIGAAIAKFELPPEAAFAADVTQDNRISATDALIILKAANGEDIHEMIEKRNNLEPTVERLGPGRGNIRVDDFSLQRIRLSAEAASGSVFSGWSGACSGMGICEIDPESGQQAFANFVTAEPDLAVGTKGVRHTRLSRVGRSVSFKLYAYNKGGEADRLATKVTLDIYPPNDVAGGEVEHFETLNKARRFKTDSREDARGRAFKIKERWRAKPGRRYYEMCIHTLEAGVESNEANNCYGDFLEL